MFEQYCEFRDREKDPNRYKNNRGNKLAKQLAEFNALKKKMPRFEDLLIGDVATWQSEHDKFFEINVSLIHFNPCGVMDTNWYSDPLLMSLTLLHDNFSPVFEKEVKHQVSLVVLYIFLV